MKGEFPTERLTALGDEYGAFCPHCGEWHTIETDDPDNLTRHPAVPEDEPVTCLCGTCNGTFGVIE